MGAKPTFSDIEKLVRELLLPFYQVERDMPLPFDDTRDENDAEHSWSLAVLACALAHEVEPSLDLGKVCMFAVVHDLVEVYAGDTSLWSDPAHVAGKAEREHAALARIVKEYPQFSWISKTIEEYEAKDTPEATYVWALDKFLNYFIIYLTKGHYYQKKRLTKEDTEQRLAEHRLKARSHPQVAYYYDKLLEAIEAHPKFFYEEKR